MAQKVRLTKSFDFETGHALDDYEGKCKDIHGHSYHLEVTVMGYPNEDTSISDCGMVMDFGDIKKIVRDKIMGLFDHRLVLRDDSRFKGLEKLNERVRYVKYQPTCENMMLEMVDILKAALPENVTLANVMLQETATSYSEWRIEDNL